MAKETTFANTRCLIQACQRLGIPYVIHDHHDNFVEIKLNQPYFFTNTITPFNTGSINKICRDKEFCYRLLEGRVLMPRTRGYFNPLVDEKNKKFVLFPTVEAIKKDILDNFSLPIIVKRNSGSLGSNVFLCRTSEEIDAALETIYTRDIKYDYIALAQDYIDPVAEYRVVIFKGEIIFAYEKNITEANFAGNLSPLHQEGARATLVDDFYLLAEFKKMLISILSYFPVEYAGLDVIRDKAGRLILIEINGQPGFSYFVRDNGEEVLINLYERMISELARRDGLKLTDRKGITLEN